MIEIKDVSKHFGKTRAVDHVSFSVRSFAFPAGLLCHPEPAWIITKSEKFFYHIVKKLIALYN
jgi:hypothetical protein